jgi:hypothetical protein
MSGELPMPSFISNSGLRQSLLRHLPACYFTEPPAGAHAWRMITRATDLLSSSCYSEPTGWVSSIHRKSDFQGRLFLL